MKSYIEKRGNVFVKVDYTGGCQPATDFEIELWTENARLKEVSMTDNSKEKYLKEIEMLQQQYPKFQQLVVEFGLDHHGNPVHGQMENLLQFMREHVKNLKERL